MELLPFVGWKLRARSELWLAQSIPHILTFLRELSLASLSFLKCPFSLSHQDKGHIKWWS